MPRAQGCKPWAGEGVRSQALGARAQDLRCPCILGVGNCSYRYSKHLFDHKMTNDSIDGKGTRAKALGARARALGARAQDL